MADALRALRVLPPLYQALSIHLVEVNPVLRDKQMAALSGTRNVTWHDTIDDVPDGPSVIFANEYFDVLPIHQAVKAENGWHERTVEFDATADWHSVSRAIRSRVSRCCCRPGCGPLPSARYSNGGRMRKS